MNYFKSALTITVLIISLAAFTGCSQSMKSDRNMAPAQHATSTTP